MWHKSIFDWIFFADAGGDSYTVNNDTKIQNLGIYLMLSLQFKNLLERLRVHGEMLESDLEWG